MKVADPYSYSVGSSAIKSERYSSKVGILPFRILHDKFNVNPLEHDFFEAQPIKNPSVFLLKNILHDWSDKYAKKILMRLRAAAGPDTRLVTRDTIIPYSCQVPVSDNALSILA